MTECKGIEWWERLPPWHKMAVVLYFPLDSHTQLATVLKVGTRNKIVGIRNRIKQWAKKGIPIPAPCLPEEVHKLEIPPDAPRYMPPKGSSPRKDGDRNRKDRKRRKRKKRQYIAAPIPRTKCAAQNCKKDAVPRLAFCADCARLNYKPMTKQIAALIDAAS